MTLEGAVRKRLRDLDALIADGKHDDKWPHPSYVPDATWHSWLGQAMVLRIVLSDAGLDIYR
jgi:hypothetical protein